LLALDHLRHGIGLRAFGQRDPLNEYKQEAFGMFEGMLTHLRVTVTTVLSHIELRLAPEASDQTPKARRMSEGRALPGNGEDRSPPPPRGTVKGLSAAEMTVAAWGKVGRNKPCPCGSGKKYKHCHGKVV
jgi:preprotein translocase subunit SecA